MKFRPAVVLLLLALCQSSFAQRELPFKEIAFEGVSTSGFHRGEPFEYFLIKRKIFAGLPIAQESAVIQEWSNQHPNASALPVSILGEKSALPMVYVWAVDGNDNLNVYLVRKGVHPAIAMLDTAKFDRLLQASSNATFIKLAARVERAGNPTGVVSRRLISTLRYDRFMHELVAAESAARDESLGIWADAYKTVRDRIGLLPLGSLPITIDELDMD